ncbi:metXA [Symbiodinium necroappetens]|uniref:MetXA protein n=1 Tax=Symbiodinium necroappetens TaxID=1628268 RepID=A0A813CET4_9DINO|nr:metXA [Symbiodinium necroappetens]
MASEAVLVTGASGRLGSQIVTRLVEGGLSVVATDRVSPADKDKLWGPRAHEVTFVQADLCDAAAMKHLAAKVTSVVHVGAIPGPSEHPPPPVDPVTNPPIGLEKVTGVELLRQNLLGTCMLFEAIAALPASKRVVFSSSLFAMGWSHEPAAFMPDFLPLDETHVPEPLEHYGLSKCFCEDFAEMLLRAARTPSVEDGEAENGPPCKRPKQNNLSFVSLRFSNIIKAEKWTELPLKLPQHAVTPLMWAYCHEHDVVEAHVKALLLPSSELSSKCETFLVVAPDTRYDVPTVELIKHHFNKTGCMLPGQSNLFGFASIVSNRKAERLLGLTFRSFRSSGLEHALADEARIFEAPASFRLRTGEAASGLRLVYKMYGQLNAEKSNCILHPTSFDATHPELEFNIGPGQTLDTRKFCVIIINLLGNGLSTSPSSRLGKDHEQFPQGGTTMCDNVRLQALLLDSLGVTSLALVYGYSMGAMQALHWAAMFPNRVKRVAAVCGSAQPSDFNITFLDSLEAALLADSDCKDDGRLGMRLHGSCQRGLKAFARIYAGWGVSREFYKQEIWRKTSRDGQPFTSREDFVRRSYEGGFINASPLNLLAQIRTWRCGNICEAYGMPSGISLKDALGRITARVVLMPCSTDAYFSAADIELEAQMISKCRFMPINSVWGHRAGDPHRPGQEAGAVRIARLNLRASSCRHAVV